MRPKGAVEDSVHPATTLGVEVSFGGVENVEEGNRPDDEGVVVGFEKLEVLRKLAEVFLLEQIKHKANHVEGAKRGYALEDFCERRKVKVETEIDFIIYIKVIPTCYIQGDHPIVKNK